MSHKFAGHPHFYRGGIYSVDDGYPLFYFMRVCHCEELHTVGVLILIIVSP
jgi:hypothetical protein